MASITASKIEFSSSTVLTAGDTAVFAVDPSTPAIDPQSLPNEHTANSLHGLPKQYPTFPRMTSRWSLHTGPVIGHMSLCKGMDLCAFLII